ncbi:hypothetical protein Tco_0896517 [Tanacetum coccineum]
MLTTRNPIILGDSMLQIFHRLLLLSNSESAVNDSDSEEVENVFVEDNGKPIDGLVDDARKKVEVPPRGLPGKLVLGRVEKRTLLKET